MENTYAWIHTTPNSITTNNSIGNILNITFIIFFKIYLNLNLNFINEYINLHINNIRCLQVIFTIIRTDKEIGRARLLIISIITKNKFNLKGDPEGLKWSQ